MFASVILSIIITGSMNLYAPMILTIAAIPTFISGFIIRFKPLIVGGVTFWVLALAAHFGGPDISSLAVPVAMLTGYLIPGYLLKRSNNHGNI